MTPPTTNVHADIAANIAIDTSMGQPAIHGAVCAAHIAPTGTSTIGISCTNARIGLSGLTWLNRSIGQTTPTPAAISAASARAVGLYVSTDINELAPAGASDTKIAATMKNIHKSANVLGSPLRCAQGSRAAPPSTLNFQNETRRASRTPCLPSFKGLSLANLALSISTGPDTGPDTDIVPDIGSDDGSDDGSEFANASLPTCCFGARETSAIDRSIGNPTGTDPAFESGTWSSGNNSDMHEPTRLDNNTTHTL